MRDRFNFDAAEKWFWRGFFIAAGATGLVLALHAATISILWIWRLLHG